MSLGEKIRELDEQVATAVRRAVDELRAEMRKRLDEATEDLQRRLGEVAPELPRSFVDEEELRRIAEEAAAPSGEALETARAEGWAAGRAAARDEARRDAFEAVRAGLAEIDRAGSQADLLQRLLDGSAPHAPRAAVLLLRGGRLSGWGARGFEGGEEAARSVSLAADEEPWSALSAGGAAARVAGARCATLVSQLDGAVPSEACVVPLVLRDRVAAVLYADRPEGADEIEVGALQVLTYGAALALEALAFREREATSTLLPVAEGEAAGEVAEGAEAEVEAPVGVEPAEDLYELEGGFEMEVEEVDLELEPALEVGGAEALEEVEPAGLEEEPAEDALAGPPDLEAAEEDEAVETAVEEGEPGPGGEEAAAGFELPDAPATPPHGDELVAGRYEYLEEAEEAAAPSEAVDEGALDESAVEEAPELEEPATPAEPAPEGEEGGDRIPWRTETRESTAVAPPTAEEAPGEEAPVEDEVGERPEAGAVPAPPPKPGGPVEPPADVEGPGWAFSAAREPVGEQDEAAHEEARRLARLLVSEIQLYNQDEVDEGRRHRDIYERLRDDIDRSRQLYEERVDPGVRETTDYFYQELVRQLAAGDAKALGI